MKNLLLALLLLSNYTIAQNFGFDGQSVFGIHAGIAQGNNEIDFIKQNNYNVNSLYNNNISFIEISISSTDYSSLEGKYLKKAGSMTFKYFYPVYSTDSIKTKYSGYLFGMDLYGINFLPKTKWIDFVISTGFNIGSKKVRIDRDVKYKNWIFAPRISSELRFIVKQKFAISLKAETQYDITKDRFKLKKGEDVLNLKGFKYNPIMISAGIGWVL
jgi:hypothetical protein